MDRGDRGKAPDHYHAGWKDLSRRDRADHQCEWDQDFSQKWIESDPGRSTWASMAGAFALEQEAVMA